MEGEGSHAEGAYAHLDAARGVAAFIVLLGHMVQIFWLRIFGADSWVRTVSSEASHYAVIVFFVLSGFLICQSIEINVFRNGRFRVLEYAASRFARIYPPFLAALIATLLVFTTISVCGLPGSSTPLGFAADLFRAREVLQLEPRDVALAFFLQGGLTDVNGPLWSLYIEVKLYVLLACIYVMVRGGPLAKWIALLTACATVALAHRFNPDFFRYAAVWLVGCGGSYLRALGKSPERSKFVCSVFAIALCVFLSHLDVADASHLELVVELSLAVAFAVALLGLRWRSPIGAAMAGYSYTLYVVHFPILLLIHALFVRSGRPDLVWTALFALLGCLTSIAVCRCLEGLERRKRDIQIYIEKLAEQGLAAFTRAFAK